MASVDAVFGQAPSGMDLSESQAHNITGGISAMLALSIISVSLRIYARLVVKKVGLELDDWTIIAAQVCKIPGLFDRITGILTDFMQILVVGLFAATILGKAYCWYYVRGQF